MRAAIQAAGGEDEGCDNTPMLPVYSGGRVFPPFSLDDLWHGEKLRHAADAPGCVYSLPLTVPHIDFAGGRSVAGSFTALGADEVLQFVGVGSLDGARDFELVSLQDQQGVVRPIMAIDHYTDYQGLCLDRETNTHTAVFTRSYDGTCCRPDTVYYHYDADAGNLAEVFVNDALTQPTGGDAVCHWRDNRERLEQ